MFHLFYPFLTHTIRLPTLSPAVPLAFILWYIRLNFTLISLTLASPIYGLEFSLNRTSDLHLIAIPFIFLTFFKIMGAFILMIFCFQ